jgi:hypothetical protein
LNMKGFPAKCPRNSIPEGKALLSYVHGNCRYKTRSIYAGRQRNLAF